MNATLDCGSLRNVPPFGRSFPLHPGDAEEHVTGETAFGRAGVQVFRCGLDNPARALDALKQLYALTWREAREAVEPVDDEARKLAVLDALDRVIEDRTIDLRARYVDLGRQVLDR